MKVLRLGTGERTGQCNVCDSTLQYTADEVFQPVKSMPQLCFVTCKACGNEAQVPYFVNVPEGAEVDAEEVEQIDE